MANSKKSKDVLPKSSLSERSSTTAPSSDRSSGELAPPVPIQISPEELLSELQNDPAAKLHVDKAMLNVALRKQTEMFQAVQKELAEAREELARHP